MNEEMTLDEIRQLEYAGGGYFRLPGPVGKKAKIIHGPELHKLLLEILDQSGSGNGIHG